MDIRLLEKLFKDILVLSEITTEEFSLEGGIRFISPLKCGTEHNAVFAGNLKNYRAMLKNGAPAAGATYLVCTREGSQLPKMQAGPDYNVLFLNASLDVVVNRLNDAVSAGFETDGENDGVYRDFMTDLLNGSLSEKPQILKRAEAFKYPFRPHLAVIVVQSTKTKNTQGHRKEKTALCEFFEQCNVFYYEKKWVILYSQSKDTSERLDMDYEKFSELLRETEMYAGISYPCQLPEAFGIMYHTANAAVTLGRAMEFAPVVKNIYTYREMNPYFAIHLGARQFMSTYKTDNLMFLAHPDVVKLYYHDLRRKDNLIDVLFEYVISQGNVQLTANKLYMHRNTVQNKLNKIREIADLDFDQGENRFLLLFSCFILKYLQKYIKKDLEELF